MEDTNEKLPTSELFPNLEGIERGNALLDKLRDILPDEEIPDVAWKYGENGEVVDITYLVDLTMAVAMEGGQAEEIHSQLHKLIEAEKNTTRFPELLTEADTQVLEDMSQNLDKFSPDEIERVQSITEVEVASLDSNRTLMNVAVNYYGPILSNMLKTTKVSEDTDHTKHPLFWELLTRVDSMRTAVGILGRDGIRRIPRTY